jgi:hypothetical protein
MRGAILAAVLLLARVATAERIGIDRQCGARVMERIAAVATPGVVPHVRVPGKCVHIGLPSWLNARARRRPGQPTTEVEVYLGRKLVGVLVLMGHRLGAPELEAIETQPKRRWVTRRWSEPTPGQRARHRTEFESVEEWTRD